MKPRVLVTRSVSEAGLARLFDACDVTLFSEDRPLTKRELLQMVPGCDAVISMLTDPMDRDVMEAGSRLRVISNYAVGYNNIDIQAATELGIPVTNTPGTMVNATADIHWALLMAVTRRIVEADRYVRSGAWSGWDPHLLLGMELADKTMGIIGAGRIGLTVAKRAVAFDMKVLYHNRRRLDESIEREFGMTYVSLEELLAQSDIVNLCLPYTPESHHLINSATLAQMQPSAFLINSARGPIVDEQALVDALQNRRIAGAGLDVFEAEPQVHPGLLALDNVVLAPHLGSSTVETRRRMAEMAVENVLCVLAGKQPPALVNPDVWDKRRA